MTKILFTLLLGIIPLALAQSAGPAWPARLLDQPFHVGDSSNRKDMHTPKAEGATFTAVFDLPETVRPGPAAIAWVTVRATGLLSIADKRLKIPTGRARLFLNGTEIGDLNKLSHGNGTIGPVERQQFRIPGPLLRPTGNQLEIRPGATPKNLLDFELHEVVVASTPQ